MFKKLLRIVAVVSGRIFVGPELCHNDKYLETVTEYSVDLIVSRTILQVLPPWLRSVAAPLIPHTWRLRRRLRDMEAMIAPLLTSRRRTHIAATDPTPDDMLQWLLDGEQQSGADELMVLAKAELTLSFASIHTTTITATNA